MKVLFLCRFLPHPEARDSGGQDTYHYIAALSERHSVSLMAFVKREQSADAAFMRSLCNEVIEVPYEPHALLPRVWRQWWRILLPRVYGRNISVRYWRELRTLLSRIHPDVIIVDGMMAPYGHHIQGAKRLLDEIDIYSVVAHQVCRRERGIVLRIWNLCDWLRTQAWELHYVDSYDGVLVRSQRDQTLLRSFVPDQNVSVIAPWFEGLDRLKEITLQRPRGNRLLFVGAMNLPANEEAVQYFVREVLPLVRQKVDDAELYIVGSSPRERVQQLAAEDGVVVTGEVEDLTPYYERCAVNVVPLLRGGGIIVKTLNGMAAGRPTVSTPLGNSGTGAKPGRDLIVAEEAPESFASAISELLVDRELWKTIAKNGRWYVSTNYDWSDTVRDLEQLLERVVSPE